MSRRAVTRERSAATPVLVVITTVVALAAIATAAYGAWFVLTH